MGINIYDVIQHFFSNGLLDRHAPVDDGVALLGVSRGCGARLCARVRILENDTGAAAAARLSDAGLFAVITFCSCRFFFWRSEPRALLPDRFLLRVDRAAAAAQGLSSRMK